MKKIVYNTDSLTEKDENRFRAEFFKTRRVLIEKRDGKINWRYIQHLLMNWKKEKSPF